MDNPIQVHAAWSNEYSNEYRCLWMLAWQEISNNEIAGVVAGLKNGEKDEYFIENFYAKLDGEKINALWIRNRDVFDKKLVKFTDDMSIACGEAVEVLYKWNEIEIWRADGRERLHLRKDKLNEVYFIDGHRIYVKTDADPDYISKIVGYTGVETIITDSIRSSLKRNRFNSEILKSVKGRVCVFREKRVCCLVSVSDVYVDNERIQFDLEVIPS